MAAVTNPSDLETPAVLVDLDRLEANLRRMSDYAAEHGLALRPHVKTHKSTTVARRQLSLGAAGVTCATPREAEVMAQVSNDILIAHPLFGPKLKRVMQLHSPVALSVLVDSPEAIDALGRAAHEAGRPVSVLVELDVGLHRTGVVDASTAAALAARIARHPSLSYAGIGWYPGHIREHVDAQEQQLRELRELTQRALDTLQRAGVAPRVMSGGSTPIAWQTHTVPGLTEIRPGTYVYNDRTTAAVGACDWDDCALTVLATVISTSVPGQAVIDAGSKALGREPMRGVAHDGEDWGFGSLINCPEVRVIRMSEEHGILDLSRTTWRPAVGETVRVVPNHVCIVTHLNDMVYGVRGDRVETTWAIEARGREPVA